MKAITIIQPYAHLIATGVKRVENRSWPTSYRGPIAIHAGKAKSYGGEPVEDIAQSYDIDQAVLVYGAVIATANLIDCVRLIDPAPLRRTRLTPPDWAKKKYPWLADHEHTEGPVCWVLDNVQRIDPVFVNGAQGLWEWKR